MLDIHKEDVDLRRLLTISKFAKLVGVPTSTIRYWVQIGKLKPTAYRDSGYMLFDPKQKDNIN
jgi:DNA-binding transcriptional MerR regulator